MILHFSPRTYARQVFILVGFIYTNLVQLNLKHVYRGGSRIFGSGVQISWGGGVFDLCSLTNFPEIPHENEII